MGRKVEIRVQGCKDLLGSDSSHMLLSLIVWLTALTEFYKIQDFRITKCT